MIQNPSGQFSLYTEEEAQQLQLESVAHGHSLPNGHVRLHPANVMDPGQSESTLPPSMPYEELADLLAEALQGHRLVLEGLLSTQELLTKEFTATRTAIDRVTNLVINLENVNYYEDFEEDDAIQT